MQSRFIIKINFRGGIISPGELYNILVAASKAGIYYVSFGLRQQLLIDVPSETAHLLMEELKSLDIPFENQTDEFPNIISSYPEEEVFINNTWLSEGVYKDIFDSIDYQPRVKIMSRTVTKVLHPCLRAISIGWLRQLINIFGTFSSVFRKPIRFMNGMKWYILMMYQSFQKK